MNKVLENPNPKIYPRLEQKLQTEEHVKKNPDEYDSRDIFELLRNINDPEHPLTLEQLNVIEQKLIEVDNVKNQIDVKFTPTIPHCSMATLIGLSIRTQLLRMIPPKFKVSVTITPGTHVAEIAVNKQLADKERVAAALENKFLLTVIEQCLENTINPNNEDDEPKNECCGGGCGCSEDKGDKENEIESETALNEKKKSKEDERCGENCGCVDEKEKNEKDGCGDNCGCVSQEDKQKESGKCGESCGCAEDENVNGNIVQS